MRLSIRPAASAATNAAFKGDYDGAVRRYTWALRLSDVDHKPLGAVGADDAPGTADACDGTAALRCTLLINRATAMAQLGAFDAVEADCTRALAIVPRSAKVGTCERHRRTTSALRFSSV